MDAFKENSSLEETLQTIDGSIKSYQKAVGDLMSSIMTLKARRNSLAPVSRLPAEILGIIFSLVQTRKVNPNGKRGGTAFQWLNLTYVCRYWRNVALDFPSLWVDLPVQSRRMVKLLLERSKECGLIIDADVSDSCFMHPGLELALMQTHRIKDLTMRICRNDTEEWNNKFDDMLQNPLPQLERFCLVGPENGYLPTIYYKVLRETGRMRQLELTRCYIGWEAHPILRQPLIHLKIHDVLDHLLPTWEEFMDVLQALPSLQVLDLKHTIPVPDDFDSGEWDAGNVHLAELHALRIQDMFYSVRSFLRNVTFPPSAVVQVTLHPLKEDSTFDDVIEALARSYSNTDPTSTFRSLFLEKTTSSEEAFRMKLYIQEFEGYDARSETTIPNLEIVFFCSIAETLPNVLVNLVESSISVDDIQHLSLSKDIPRIHANVMVESFGKFRNLHSVVIAGYGAESFLSAMRNVMKDQIAESNLEILRFPCFSSLFLSDLRFCDRNESFHYSIPAFLTVTFKDILRWRQGLGVPIEKLNLRKCPGLKLADIMFLEKIVASVEWDEYEGK